MVVGGGKRGAGIPVEVQDVGVCEGEGKEAFQEVEVMRYRFGRGWHVGPDWVPHLCIEAGNMVEFVGRDDVWRNNYLRNLSLGIIER